MTASPSTFSQDVHLLLGVSVMFELDSEIHTITPGNKVELIDGIHDYSANFNNRDLVYEA